jgi:hypothetical protein
LTGSVTNFEDTTEVTSYAQAYLPKSDPNRIFRIVGFLEYSMALRYLDKLALNVSEEETDAIDEIIKSEPEFKVYTNLSRRLQLAPSSLTEKPQREKDDYSRHGFKWVTALARVELGGMLGSFTSHPAPFAAVAGKGYDAPEYMELLVDGARTHYWALANDPQFKLVMKKFNPDAKSLTYLRRLNLATAFITAAVGIAPQQFTPVQLAEFQSYLKPINDARKSIRTSIEVYVNTIRSAKSTSTSSHSLVEQCYDGVCVQYEN